MKPQFKAINEDTEMRSLDGGRTWQIPGPSDAREAMEAISIGDGTGDGTGEGKEKHVKRIVVVVGCVVFLLGCTNRAEPPQRIPSDGAGGPLDLTLP